MFSAQPSFLSAFAARSARALSRSGFVARRSSAVLPFVLFGCHRHRD